MSRAESRFFARRTGPANAPPLVPCRLGAGQDPGIRSHRKMTADPGVELGRIEEELVCAALLQGSGASEGARIGLGGVTGGVTDSGRPPRFAGALESYEVGSTARRTPNAKSAKPPMRNRASPTLLRSRAIPIRLKTSA